MQPVLFSVSYAGLWGQEALDLVSFIHKAGELGFPAVELMAKRPHLSVLETGEARLAEIREAADAAGVDITTIAGYNDFTSGKQSGEVPFVEIQVAYIRELCRVAQSLGAQVVRIFTGYTTDERAYGSDWATCVSAIRQCGEIAGDYGVLIGVQNHHDVGVGVDSYIELLDDIGHPCVKAMFDPWSVALQGADLGRYARELAPRMIQTTLADYVRQKRLAYMPGLINYRELPDMVRAVPLGEGFSDLDAFFCGLRDGGFDGYVAYEMCSPLRGGGSTANLDRTATIALDRIRKLIAEYSATSD